MSDIVLGFHVGLSLLHGCACAFLGEIIEIIEMMEQREQKPNSFGLCRVATEEGDSQMMEQREQKPLSATAESSRLDYAESRLLTTVKSRGRRQPNE